MAIPGSILTLALAAMTALTAAEDQKAPRRHRHPHHDCQSTFAWQAQANLPLKELGQAQDHRTGLGLGVQWRHDHGQGHSSRTRFEWNTFRESPALGAQALKTRTSNYILSFDRLYHVSGRDGGFYVVGGLGAVRWFQDRTAGPEPTRSSHTTKLGVTAGAGWRFNDRLSLEARYLVSSLDRTFDGNVLQAGLSLRF
jgi:opacity protein-like surface antigen